MRSAYRNWLDMDDRAKYEDRPRYFVMTRDRDKSFVHKVYPTRELADAEAERLRIVWELPDYCDGMVYVVESKGEE